MSKTGKLRRVFRKVEDLAAKLPNAIGAPVVEHVRAVRELFAEGRLDAARKSRSRAEKLETARIIVETSAALCTTIALEPLPLADFPFLTSIQIAMVSGIAYV